MNKFKYYPITQDEKNIIQYINIISDYQLPEVIELLIYNHYKLLKIGLEYDFLIKLSEGDWNNISNHQELSCDFIDFYSDKLNWTNISKNQNLSENIINLYCDKVDWHEISLNQDLSENIIEKFSDKLHWECISIYRRLSKEFIDLYRDKLLEMY